MQIKQVMEIITLITNIFIVNQVHWPQILSQSPEVILFVMIRRMDQTYIE